MKSLIEKLFEFQYFQILKHNKLKRLIILISKQIEN